MRLIVAVRDGAAKYVMDYQWGMKQGRGSCLDLRVKVLCKSKVNRNE